LAGLRSRWTTPFAWALASASASGTAIASSSSSAKPPADGGREGAPLHQFHRKEVDVAFHFDGMQGDDVGMFQARDHGRFPFEAGPSLRVVRDLGRQHLDRHIAAQAAIAPAIDVSHASGAELLEDVVVREPGADQDACLLGCLPPARSADSPLTVEVVGFPRQCTTATPGEWRPERSGRAPARPPARLSERITLSTL
jgi:hypothetical protein